MFGSPETTTGGNALKFYASVRLDIRRIGQVKEKDETVGNQTRVKVVKNKVAPPFRVVEFDIMYGEGISKTGELIDLGIKVAWFEKSAPGSPMAASASAGPRERKAFPKATRRWPTRSRRRSGPPPASAAMAGPASPSSPRTPRPPPPRPPGRVPWHPGRQRHNAGSPAECSKATTRKPSSSIELVKKKMRGK
jgi:hypothetical protein